MSSLEAKREQFRRYLECCGVIDSLSKALIKLYEETNKPEDAVRFLRRYMCETCPTDEDYEELKAKCEAAETLIKSLERQISSCKGNMKRTPSEIDLLLEEGFTQLEEDEECSHLLKKHLTREVLDALKPQKTTFKSTLLDAVQSGFANHDSHIGIYSPDAEAYTTFADLFDPIIEDYHGGFQKCDIHPDFDWGDATCMGDLDPENEFIISTRVRCGRNLENYPFNPKMTEDEYISLESEVKNVLENLDGDYKGTYYPLLDMDKEIQQKLIDDHFLFKEGDRFLEAARSTRYWPVGRGIFFNEARNFLIWVNEEDHLRIISMECGGNLGAVYTRLSAGVDQLSEKLQFARSERLGFLTFCPTNLGTTIRASVHIKLPKLSADMEKFEEVAAEHHLQIRGTRGEFTEGEGGVFDISNKERLGLTEFDAVKTMYDGITQMITMEREME